MTFTSRRSFIRSTALVSFAAALVPTVWAGKAARLFPIRLGGPAFAKTSDPEELARIHRDLGYRAAYCPDIPLDASDKIKAVEKAFAAHDVVIAEVGRWVNLLDSDPEKRRTNLKLVTEGLALADAVGARCCVDIAGSYNPDSWFGPHPDNFSRQHFDASVENVRKIIDAVKPRRARFCYEMMGWAHPHDVASSLKLLRAVDRPAFGVHLDPCNLVNSPEKFYDTTTLLNECFDKLGRWIVSCHAKDLAWEVEMNVHFREVVPGKGSLDYRTFLKRLAALPQNPPLMIEHLSGPKEYAEARDHIFAVGKASGVRFE